MIRDETADTYSPGVRHPCGVKSFMWLTADMLVQWYGFTDKFTLKFLIGAETSINMSGEGGTGRERVTDGEREL